MMVPFLFRRTAVGGLVLLSLLNSTPLVAADPASSADRHASYRQWIADMRAAERGPFSRIRWFCKDGSILEPEPFACEPYGGGAQHGEWSDKTKKLRAEGFYVANILEDLDEKQFVASADAADRLNHILFEQFLIGRDDGWILHKARAYRGALQFEGEIAGGQRLLAHLLRDKKWADEHRIPLRAAARLLPHGVSEKSIIQIREVSAALADRDAKFSTLRNKIHNRPEFADADAVRQYAANTADAEPFNELAALIEAVYSRDAVFDSWAVLAKRVKKIADLDTAMTAVISQWQSLTNAEDKFRESARILKWLRDIWPRWERAETKLAALRLSQALEDAHYIAGAQWQEQADNVSRELLLARLRASLDAAYGVDLLSAREHAAQIAGLDPLAGGTVSVAAYKAAIDYAARVPGWGTQRMHYFYGESAGKFAQIEPKVLEFTQDQLRGSPLFHYAKIVDQLATDAHRLAGARSELFGSDAAGSLRPLNPGIARGVLYLVDDVHTEKLAGDGIYVLPETIAELTPVAGIVTLGEGNPLSHVQLLARNLGIPNVAAGSNTLEALKAHAGKHVLLAVSGNGGIELNEDHGQADAAFQKNSSAADAEILIRVELDKLDTDKCEILDLHNLRAADSGRVVGPKAAKLGELKAHYPDKVSDGLAIPFACFREHLSQPMPDADLSVFAWMVSEYARIASLSSVQEKQIDTQALRARMEDWLLQHPPDDGFRQQLQHAVEQKFGKGTAVGLFVRSDTNVEDLGGFTGAGLNLTLPNVVGLDNLIAAITKVWASPFSARSFAWRQARMDKPEHVYPAILLQHSVPNEKSGVLVNRDIETGAAGILSVAVNEGVGGAVDGQAAESLRIDMQHSGVKLLAQATAPWRRTLPAAGGIENLPASGSDYVLQENEIAQLITFARELPDKFPPITDSSGAPAAADVEFGFLNGELRLFQIRPFLESAKARASGYLQSLDGTAVDVHNTMVDFTQAPTQIAN